MTGCLDLISSQNLPKEGKKQVYFIFFFFLLALSNVKLFKEAGGDVCFAIKHQLPPPLLVTHFLSIFSNFGSCICIEEKPNLKKGPHDFDLFQKKKKIVAGMKKTEKWQSHSHWNEETKTAADGSYCCSHFQFQEKSWIRSFPKFFFFSVCYYHVKLLI